jgi:hypothetical protein
MWDILLSSEKRWRHILAIPRYVYHGWGLCWQRWYIQRYAQRAIEQALRTPLSKPCGKVNIVNIVADIERVVRRSPITFNCLTRSLYLIHVLAKAGVQTQLRIGVRINEDDDPTATPAKLAAHAWVEYHGRPLNDDAHNIARYRVFNQDLPMAFAFD